MSDSFRTKAGRCVVEADRLRLEPRDGGALGTLRDALTAADVPAWRRAAVVLFFVAVVAGVAAAVRLLPAWLVGVTVGLAVAALIRGWWRGRSRGVTEPEEIPLEDVVGVEPHRGLPLLTRPRFVVRYRDEGGVKHRYLLCPSRLYGFGSFEAGCELFAERGLLVEEGNATGGD